MLLDCAAPCGLPCELLLRPCCHCPCRVAAATPGMLRAAGASLFKACLTSHRALLSLPFAPHSLFSPLCPRPVLHCGTATGGPQAWPCLHPLVRARAPRADGCALPCLLPRARRGRPARTAPERPSPSLALGMGAGGARCLPAPSWSHASVGRMLHHAQHCLYAFRCAPAPRPAGLSRGTGSTRSRSRCCKPACRAPSVSGRWAAVRPHAACAWACCPSCRRQPQTRRWGLPGVRALPACCPPAACALTRQRPPASPRPAPPLPAALRIQPGPFAGYSVVHCHFLQVSPTS